MTQTTKKDYIWNSLGVFLQNAISPILLIVVTRVNGIEVSGMFSFAFSIAIVLFALGLWGGRTYQVSDMKREFDHVNYIFARILLGIIMIICAFLFVLINSYDANKAVIIMVLVVYKVIDVVADSIYGILQVNNGLIYVGKSLFYKSIVGLIMFIIIDVATKNIIYSSMAFVVVNFCMTFLYDIYHTKKVENIHIKIKSIKQHTSQSINIIRQTAAIFAVTFLATFSINISRFFIDKYDSAAIGYFGIIATPITLIALMMSFILQPQIVNIAQMYDRRKYDDVKKTVRTVMTVTLIFGLVLALGTFIVGIPILDAIFGVSFENYELELIIMVIGGVINAFIAIYINILTIIRKFKIQFYTLLFTNALLTVMCLVVVKQYGILGGTILFTITNLVQLIILSKVYYVTLK